MNASVSFDTPAFGRKLEASGMEVRKADALGEIVFETTATNLEPRALEVKLAFDLRELELRLASPLMIKLGGAIASSTTLAVAILGALISLH